MEMEQAWRWFGPSDPVQLKHIREAGASVIVSSLSDVPIGEVWPVESIRAHKALIASEGLRWEVVESVPIHDDIKRAARGHEKYIENFRQTLINLAAEGIKTICYNFMPILDWTRTDLRRSSSDGSATLRFDVDSLAVFDLKILKRPGAEEEYTQAQLDRAQRSFEAMTAEERDQLTANILQGLPGRSTDSLSLDELRDAIASYRNISRSTLHRNLVSFLRDILPTAAQFGVKMAIHPDDPPRQILGLPRAICTADDLRQLFQALARPENGLTFCLGTLSSRGDNDVLQLAREFAPRVAFAHLRTTRIERNGSFDEVSHLEGAPDLYSILRVLQTESESRSSGAPIYFRPDHGKLLSAEQDAEGTNPGYSYLGRLKGLAELRGALWALDHSKARGELRC